MATEKRLISLDEAIAKIKDDGLLGSGYSDDERMDDVIDILESCHVVDAVEVVHGRWVNPYINRYGHPCHCCSECGFKASYQDKNYCPNCGASMKDGDGNG